MIKGVDQMGAIGPASQHFTWFVSEQASESTRGELREVRESLASVQAEAERQIASLEEARAKLEAETVPKAIADEMEARLNAMTVLLDSGAPGRAFSLLST